jgi:uncharacterized membrane protein (DUF4010 family)
MPSSEMLRRVDLVRIDVSDEHITSIITVTRIGELEMLAVILIMDAISSSETSVLTMATRRNIPDDSILQNLL